MAQRVFLFPVRSATPLLAERSFPCDLLRLCEKHRTEAQCLLTFSEVKLPIEAVLEFAIVCSPELRETLSATICGALSSALSASDTARKVSLFAAALAAITSAPSSSAIQKALPVLHKAAECLLPPEATNVPTGRVVGAAAEQAVAAVLERFVTLAKEKRPGSSAAIAPAQAEALGSLIGVVIRRESSSGGGGGGEAGDGPRYAGHAALVRALEHSAHLHDTAAEAVAVELRAGGNRAASSLHLLATMAMEPCPADFEAEPSRPSPAVSSPAASLMRLAFLVHAVAPRAPLAIVAGVDAGAILGGRHLQELEALPGVHRTNARKLGLQLIVGLAECNLPSSVIARSSLRRLATLLIERATDDELDIPTRSHAATTFVQLLDAARNAMWSNTSSAQGLPHGAQTAQDGNEGESSDGSEEDVDTSEAGHEAATGRAGEKAYLRCVTALVAALPSSAALSKLLTSKLLKALSAALESNPWHALLAFDTDDNSNSAATGSIASVSHAETGTSSQGCLCMWRQTLSEHFEPMLAALEAVDDASHALLAVLEQSRLGVQCLGALLRRSVASRNAPAEKKAVPPSDGATKGSSSSAEAVEGGVRTSGNGAGWVSDGSLLTRLLRVQILGGTGLLEAQAAVADGAAQGPLADRAAERLVRVVMTARCDAPECDALLHALLASASESERVMASLVAIALPPPEAQPCRGDRVPSSAWQHDARDAQSVASLRLLSRAARITPAAVLRLLPLDRLLLEIEAALKAAHSSQAEDSALPHLVELSAVAARHGGGSASHFKLLVDRGPGLAICGAAAALFDGLFAYPSHLARSALPAILDALRVRAVGKERGATASLMCAIGVAAGYTVSAVHEELQEDFRQQQQAVRPGTAGDVTAGVEGVNEYDYMGGEAQAEAQEEYVASALLQRLRSDPVFACLPVVIACGLNGNGRSRPSRRAQQEGSEEEDDDDERARVAAVHAMGRMMHAHERICEAALPSLLCLSAREHPPSVRCATTLVFASLLVAFPAQAEPHMDATLREALGPKSPRSLRLTALSALRDLVLMRRLQPSAELPHLLALGVDADVSLSGDALTCVRQLAAIEGSTRWCRLLHSSVLQICPVLQPASFSKLVQALIPSSIEASRPHDLEPLGEALAAHVVDAATLQAAKRSPADIRCRANLAALLGAWPPSDRSLAVLHKALAGQSALFAAVAREELMLRGLLSHAARAKIKCAGVALEAVMERLRAARATTATGGGADEESDNEELGDDDLQLAEPDQVSSAQADAAPITVTKRGRRAIEPTATLGGDDESAAMERTAREAIGALKGDLPLYALVELPVLPSVGGGGRSAADGGRGKEVLNGGQSKAASNRSTVAVKRKKK